MPHSAPILVVLACLAWTASIAQTSPYPTGGFADLPPPALSPADPPPAKLAFSLEAEIPLPGPLPGTGPRLREGKIEIDVAGGTAVTAATADAAALVVPSIEPPATAGPEGWVESENGRRRYRVEPGGKVVAQRRCKRCKSGWKRSWRLRVAGNTVAPPLVTARRVYFGALDNRVYSVMAPNGHRVWASDIGGRVASPLVLWKEASPQPTAAGVNEAPPKPTLVLVVPDGGTRLLALHSATGEQLATLRLEEGEGKLVSSPLATPDGRIVVARQRYLAADASLLVYRLSELESPVGGAVEREPAAASPASALSAPAAESGPP